MHATSPARRAVFSLLAVAALAQPAFAQIDKDQALVNSDPGYDNARGSLLDAAPLELNFDKANLRDVLRMLATKAGIHFLSMPMNKEWDSQLITINMKMSPFAALESVANEYGIALVYDRGVWHMRPFNDADMIARTYVIKYNTAETAEATGGTGGSSGSGGESGGSLGGGGGLGGGGSSGGANGMGGAGGGMDLGATGPAFKVEAKALLDNVKEILGVGTAGFNANFAGEVSVDEFTNSPILVPSRAPRVGTGDKAGEAKVVWNSDGNTLFVVATRQQHQMVERYIESLDRPQSLIAVELKFVETTKDPKNQLGVDWSETFDGGYKFSLTDLSTNVDLNRIKDTVIPSAAILTPDAVNVKLNFLLKDRETSTVSYPRVLTQNNREVQMRSVVNFPVLGSSSSVSQGGGGTSTSSVSFLPIGTTVNILPKRINTDKVLMHTKIVVANVIGNEIIDGNSYPVPSSRVYSAPLEVQSGYTVAIAGLDEATDSRQGTGIPVISRIPVVGWAFKNRYRDRSRKNLMIFITPTIVPIDGNGVSEKPISEVPRYHSEKDALDAPQIYTNGELKGGPAALGSAVSWSDREERRLRQICAEGRGDSVTSKEITYVGKVLDSLRGYVDYLEKNGGAEPESLSVHKWNLDQISRRTWNLRYQYFRSTIHTQGL